MSKTSDGKIQCKPILSCIVSLFAEQNELQYAVPGGLIGETVRHMSAMLRRGEVRERKGKEGSRYGGEGEEYHNRMNFWGD